MDFFRTHLKQVVTIHQAMFQKLLFEEDPAADEDLAELFHEVGKTYLQISKRISKTYSAHQSIQD